MNKKYVKLLIAAFVSLSVGVFPYSTVKAISTSTVSSGKEVININESEYVLSVNDKEDKTISNVVDENGVTNVVVYDKETDEFTLNGNKINVEITEEPTVEPIKTTKYLAKAKGKTTNKVLKRKTYTIPATVVGTTSILLSLLGSFIPREFVKDVYKTILSYGLTFKPIKTTITEYLSASKVKSGVNKGKYKYWTNVLVKYGIKTILNQNHSTVYK